MSAPAGTPTCTACVTRLVSFRDDVRLESSRRTGVTVEHRWGATRLPSASPVIIDALTMLTFGPVSLTNLTDVVISASAGDGATRAVARLYDWLEAMSFLLVHTVAIDGRPVLDAVPISASAELSALRALPRVGTGCVRLSRFAYLHRVDDDTVLENPLSRYRVRALDPRITALVGAAGGGRAVDELAESSGLPASSGPPIVDLLLAVGILEALPAAGPAAAASSVTADRLRQWSFHDLLFHARSRAGRHDEPFGATFSFRDELPHEPPVRELPAGPVVDLPAPELGDVQARDLPLLAAMETRRSIRTPGAQPLDVTELSELLYRVARVRTVYGPAPERGMPYLGVDKPIPTGGASGELDIWVGAHRCSGLQRGLYYYDPAEHRLALVNDTAADLAAMLAVAAVSAGGAATPDVLLTVTARFQRLGWKYSGIAYATTLKHVGVLYQSLYLVATAMGLAPCGLGAGDADLSARCLRLDWERESSVGDFTVSSAPADLGPSGPGRWPAPHAGPANSADWPGRIGSRRSAR